MKETKKADELKRVLEEILRLVDAQGNVEAKTSKEGMVNLSISTETPALLIGYHGRTLAALQTILKVIAYKKYGQNNMLLLDVDGWRERREETIQQLIKNAAQRAKDTGIPQPIYDLTPYERRIAHITLAEDSSMETESEGEGRDRDIVVGAKG